MTVYRLTTLYRFPFTILEVKMNKTLLCESNLSVYRFESEKSLLKHKAMDAKGQILQLFESNKHFRCCFVKNMCQVPVMTCIYCCVKYNINLCLSKIFFIMSR